MAANHQREENAAHRQHNNGITRVKGVPRDTQFHPHPSRGVSRGYDIPFREMNLENYHAGCPVPKSLMRSVKLLVKGHIHCRMTGNKSRRKLSGHYLFLLVLFQMIWPHLSYFETVKAN
jgi:hypothetical protein